MPSPAEPAASVCKPPLTTACKATRQTLKRKSPPGRGQAETAQRGAHRQHFALQLAPPALALSQSLLQVQGGGLRAAQPGVHLAGLEGGVLQGSLQPGGLVAMLLVGQLLLGLSGLQELPALTLGLLQLQHASLQG